MWRDGAHVNEKARPKSERQWQLAPVPDTREEFCTQTFWVNPAATPAMLQGRARLSPSLPLHPSLRQQRHGVERRLRHLTDVLFPASPSFSRQHRGPPIPCCSDEPSRSTSRHANPRSPQRGMLREGSSMTRSPPPLLAFSREQQQQEELPVEPISLHLGPV